MIINITIYYMYSPNISLSEKCSLFININIQFNNNIILVHTVLMYNFYDGCPSADGVYYTHI